jgi:hypothetical protein
LTSHDEVSIVYDLTNDGCSLVLFAYEAVGTKKKRAKQSGSSMLLVSCTGDYGVVVEHSF